MPRCRADPGDELLDEAVDDDGIAPLRAVPAAGDGDELPARHLGEGGAFVSGQRTAPGGAFPMNTNGGGLSYCHPGMYGMFLLVEAVRQLRGEAGDRQVAGAEVAAVTNVGGIEAGASLLTRW